MEKEGEGKIKKANVSANPVSGKIIAIILTIAILIIGSFFYFIASGNSNGAVVSSSKEMNSNVPKEQTNTNDNSNDMENTIQEPIGSKSSSEKNTQDSLINHILSENKFYTKINAEGMQKLFYYSLVNEPINIPLSEGNMAEYQIHSIGGQKYYPIIVGYEEAKIMRQEELFTNIGDPIKGFFGKNVVVVGVMQKTDGALDIVYIIPLSSGELN